MNDPMTSEESIQQALGETKGFLKRQRLLKQLWELRRRRAEEAKAERQESKPARSAAREVAQV